MSRRLPPRDKFGRFIKSEPKSEEPESDETFEKPRRRARPDRPKAKPKAKPKKRKAAKKKKVGKPKAPKAKKPRKSRAKPFKRPARPFKDRTDLRPARPADRDTRANRRRYLKWALEQASEGLKEAFQNLPPLESQVVVHVNRDGSIDAELQIISIEGVELADLYERLGMLMPLRMPEVWISNGVRFNPSEDDAENYYRYKGVSQVQSFYQEYTADNAPNNLITAREIAGKVEERLSLKIGAFFVRLFWSPEGDQPGRDDYRQDKSRWKEDRDRYNRIVANVLKGKI